MNNIINDNEFENQIITSYMEFVNTTNTSIHSMIEIINNQQTSFNQILSRYSITTRSRPSPLISQYLRQDSYLNPYSRNYSNQRAPRSNVRPNRLSDIINSAFRDISAVQVIPEDFNEPVIVRPSQRQILSAIDRLIFNNIENPLNSSCPICQVDFSYNDEVIQLKECKHIFSPTHILQWFERNVYCPLCRNDIRGNDLTVVGTGINNNPSINVPNVTSPNLNNNQTSSSQTTSFADQLANIISDQITSDPDFSGNINIELALNNSWDTPQPP